MKALLQHIKWAEKPKLSKETVLILAIVFALAVTVFKLKPCFETQSKVIVAANHEQKPSGLAAVLQHFNVGKTSAQSSKKEGTHRGKDGHVSQRIAVDPKGAGVIERPLFDGLTVTVRAILLNAVSSHQIDSPVEASVIGVIRDETASDIDAGPAEGTKLVGLATANMELKRLGFLFSELVSREGRTYSVSGSAFDSTTKMLGISANYSSGLGSRLLGVALDQGVTLADQVAVSKVLENPSNNTPVSQEMQAASIVVSQQASTNISAEATQGLRSTPAELSLPAGTEISVRLKVLSISSGGHP